MSSAEATGEAAPKHGSLAEALVAAQADIPAVDRDATATVKHKSGSSHSYSYATLGNLLAKARPALNRHGLAVTQLVADRQGEPPALVTRLMHGPTSEVLEVTSPLIAAEKTAQGFGSAITYMRRYVLAAMLGISDQDDDDGAAAADQSVAGKQQSKPKPPPAPKRRQKPATVGALVEDLKRVGWPPAEVLKWLASELGVAKHASHKNVSDVLATLSDVQANAVLTEIQRRADTQDAAPIPEPEATDAGE